MKFKNKLLLGLIITMFFVNVYPLRKEKVTNPTQELDELTQLAKEPQKIPTDTEIKTPKPKMTIDEKEFIDFCENYITKIHKSFTELAKSKKFTESAEAKRKQHEQEAKKTPYRKEYGSRSGGGSSSSGGRSSWSKPMPYESPYSSGRRGRDSTSSGSSFDGHTPEAPKIPEAKSPTGGSLGTGMQNHTNDNDSEKEKTTFSGSGKSSEEQKEERDYKRKAATLKNEAKNLAKDLQSFVSKFTDLKDKRDELEKAYANEAKHPQTKLDDFKQRISEIKKHLEALGEDEHQKLFNDSDEKTNLTAALNAYTTHLLKIAAKIDTPPTKGPSPLEGIKEMIGEMDSFGVSTKSAIRTMAEELAKAPITGENLKKAFEEFLKAPTAPDKVKACQDLHEKALAMKNLQEVDDTLGGTEVKDKKAIENTVKAYNDALESDEFKKIKEALAKANLNSLILPNTKTPTTP